MFRNIYLKTLFSLRWQLLGWALGIGFVIFLTVVVYDSIASSGLANMTKTVPASLQSLIGSLEDFASINGYIGQFVFGSKTTPVLIPMALILFIGQGVSEEDDGRLASLLSLPVTRTSTYFQKWLAVATVVTIICSMTIIFSLVAASLQHHSVDAWRLVESAATCDLMCVSLGTIAFAIGMATGRKGLTISLASAYAGGSLIISSLAPNIDSLKFVDHLSVLHYYNSPNIMLHGLNMTHTIVLAAVIIASFLFGWLLFTRRSLQLS